MAIGETEATPGKAKTMREKRGVPGGLWIRCDDCGETTAFHDDALERSIATVARPGRSIA